VPRPTACRRRPTTAHRRHRRARPMLALGPCSWWLSRSVFSERPWSWAAGGPDFLRAQPETASPRGAGGARLERVVRRATCPETRRWSGGHHRAGGRVGHRGVGRISLVVSEGGLEPLRVDLPDIGSVPALLWVPPVATAWGEIDFQSRTSPTGGVLLPLPSVRKEGTMTARPGEPGSLCANLCASRGRPRSFATVQQRRPSRADLRFRTAVNDPGPRTSGLSVAWFESAPQ
jgi:hypothetical protein